MKTTYDPTPAELGNLEFCKLTRSFHSKGRIVLNLRGVKLTRTMENPDGIDVEAVMWWRAMVGADLNTARRVADMKRVTVRIEAAPFANTVTIANDGARYPLAVFDKADKADQFVKRLVKLYESNHLPIYHDHN